METEVQNPEAQPTNAPAGLVLTAEESGTYLPDGNYRGLITNIATREAEKKATGEKFVYVDFIFKEKDSGSELTVGYPARLTTKSDLGGLFTAWGLNVPTPGQQVDLNEIFLGKETAFMVRNETNDDGTFSRIVKGSIRPTA